MTAGPDHALGDNRIPLPVVWRVLEAEPADCATARRPVRICHLLHVRERGERGLAVIAGAQRGLVHRSQLRQVGIGRGSVAHRQSSGSLHRVLPSVFALGHPVLQPLGAETAALLHCGDDCVLSHATAAGLWGLIPGPTDEVTVTLIGRHVRDVPGLRVHRVSELDIRDVRFRHGLPVTAPARTLIDVFGLVSDGVARMALNEARVLGLVADRQLLEAMDRCPRRPGTRRMRRLLAAERGPVLTRSQLEQRLREVVERAELPLPQFNVWLHGIWSTRCGQRRAWWWRWTGTARMGIGRRSRPTAGVTSISPPRDTWSCA